MPKTWGYLYADYFKEVRSKLDFYDFFPSLNVPKFFGFLTKLEYGFVVMRGRTESDLEWIRENSEGLLKEFNEYFILNALDEQLGLEARCSNNFTSLIKRYLYVFISKLTNKSRYSISQHGISKDIAIQIIYIMHSTLKELSECHDVRVAGTCASHAHNLPALIKIFDEENYHLTWNGLHEFLLSSVRHWDGKLNYLHLAWSKILKLDT